MPNEKDTAWYVLGQIDYIQGASVGDCPATTLTQRDSWERGWADSFDHFAQRRAELRAEEMFIADKAKILLHTLLRQHVKR